MTKPVTTNVDLINPTFDWVPFYKELAIELNRQYQPPSQRSALVEITKTMFENAGVATPGIISTGLSKIDPFTFFGFFNVDGNKPKSAETRTKLVSEIKTLFPSLKAQTPSSFDGIPTVVRAGQLFFNPKDADNGINALWELFKNALDFAQAETSNPSDDLLRSFDAVLNIKGTKIGKASMGLFWINSDVFLNLDEKNTAYLQRKISDIPTQDNLTARNYFDVIRMVREYMKSEQCEFHSFRELSAKAETESKTKNPSTSSTVSTLEKNPLSSESSPSPSPPKGADGKPLPRNLVWFGAPGTGKSHDAKAKIGEYFENAQKADDTIRTTFHPDSDYSTFVGAYKPNMTQEKGVYNPDELAVKLKEFNSHPNETYPCQKFAAQYWKSLKYWQAIDSQVIKTIVNNCGIKKSMNTEISKGMAVGEKLFNHATNGKIVYSFTPQAFAKAYMRAWEKIADNPQSPELQFLVIEEINRGNCAQIFGDLFQLLDRDDEGYSKYPVDPDTDLGQHLDEWFHGRGTTTDGKSADTASKVNVSERLPFADAKEKTTWADVLSGRKLVLPPNLYIWATMNTSDQSLFPMDSAFKRRWKWKYSKIKDEKQGYKIISDQYDWWKFLQKINKIIREVTSSADKQLGYFFVKLPDDLPEDKRIIDAETFVNKVVFYLWNDVFRDLELNYPAFKIQKAASPKPGDGEEGQEAGALEDRKEQYLTFDHFFKEDSDGVDADRVKTFLDNL